MSLLRRVVLAFCIFSYFSVGQAAYSGPDPSLLQPLHWRSIGPFRGGRVLSVSGVPSEPDHFYFGAVNGGLWETRDAGRTWAPIFSAWRKVSHFWPVKPRSVPAIHRISTLMPE